MSNHKYGSSNPLLNEQKTALYAHAAITGHTFDVDNPNILETATNLQK